MADKICTSGKFTVIDEDGVTTEHLAAGVGFTDSKHVALVDELGRFVAIFRNPRKVLAEYAGGNA